MADAAGAGEVSIDLDLLPDAIVVLDAGRRIVAANGPAATLAGVDAHDVVGRPLADVLDPRDAEGETVLGECWPTAAAAMRSVTAMPERDARITTSRGRVAVRLTARYLRDDHGTLTGAVVALRPARRRSTPGPTGAEVVATVSHELRSPLTSMKGYTSLLLSRWDRFGDDQKKVMLEQVQYDADRVTRMITELLDISRLETGRLVLRRQLVDIPVLVERVLTKLSLIHLDLDCDVSFPDDFPSVYADPDKLEQVLINLVENAAKYASPTGMRVEGAVEDGFVAVAVTDRGEGIPDADVAQVFRKFFRGDHGRPTGTGLGLWISRGLVEAHGGRLTATSKEGVGSTFRFTLPLVDVDALVSGSDS